jgi:carbonic anhydrase
MTVTDELLRNNTRYADSFDKGDLPLPPGKGVAVVACMDARLNVYGMLGLEEGDAHVISNAGGVITDDEIRSLTISNVFWAHARSSSSTTQTAGCSPSLTRRSRGRSRRKWG